MKTREEMITRLVDHRIDCWYEWKPYEIDDLFRSGMKGYDEMSDEELKDEYELYFEEETL
jgi:hypothetical protein